MTKNDQGGKLHEGRREGAVQVGVRLYVAHNLAAGADVPLARTTTPGPRPTVVLTPKARLAPRTTYLWQANWDRRGTRVGREGAFTTE